MSAKPFFLLVMLREMIEYNNYDKAIIVSGDGDFHCLIEYLEQKNKIGRIIIPNRKSYSLEMGSGAILKD